MKPLQLLNVANLPRKNTITFVRVQNLVPSTLLKTLLHFLKSNPVVIKTYSMT